MMPPEIYQGMLVAALAQAEGCGVVAHGGQVELTCRYEPSDELWAAFSRGTGALVGVLGWAVPLERPRPGPQGQNAFVQWRTQGWGAVGAHGKN